MRIRIHNTGYNNHRHTISGGAGAPLPLGAGRRRFKNNKQNNLNTEKYGDFSEFIKSGHKDKDPDPWESKTELCAKTLEKTLALKIQVNIH